ncbi:maltose ABC transporter substrate-binding protein [Terrabacter sp. NPDC080008]|uniref:sugar ABC transporter substrate-binding protein n=1 Tax=Terrabacter sp. NPDC080008 TaxID=3155176 RepID=UPI00344F08D7
MHKRALGAAAVTGVAALALSACGGSSPTTPSNTAAGSSAGTSKAATTTGTPETPSGTAAPVRDANVDLVIWTDADRSKAVQKYADQFAAENNVTVKVQISTDVRQQFKDATKVGKGPDVIVGAHDWLGELVQNSTVAPVSLSSDVAAKFLPSAIAATKFNGQSYGVPYAVENIGLMYNKDLVPNPPKTMDELVSMGQKLVKEGKAKQVLSQFVSKVGNAYFAYPYLSAFDGGGIFGTKANGDYDPNKLIVNSAGSVKGGEELAKLGKEKVLSTNVDDTNQDALFDTKAAPFMISGPWSVAKAKDAGINYGIAPLPSIAGGGAMKPFLGVQMFYVSSKAKNATLAQEFVTNYIPRKDVQLALFEVGKRPPALKEAYDEVAASDPDVKAWYEAGVEGKPMPNIPAMNSVWGPFGQATADIIAGKAGAKERLDAAAKEIAANIAKG